MLRKSQALVIFSILFVVCLACPARAQNYEIIEQSLDQDRHGYTVIRVWGSHYEMGYALGVALGEDIIAGYTQVKEDLGNLYATARSSISQTAWVPVGIEDEIDGIVAGVSSVVPNSDMDALDVKVLNTFGDWGYYGGCRSHSCWGDFVSGQTKTLSTRRLDFGTPFDMALHHVLIAWDPNDGSIRWVNMAWPGYVTVVTGVNAKGTLASLHDFGSDFVPSIGGVTRCVATRYVLTGMSDQPVADDLAWAESELSNMTITTGTFINYYAPEGYGGVFTCSSGGSCGAARTPQSEYMGGEVLITTNNQTDGTEVPGGGGFMGDYYEAGAPKDLAGHFGLMGTTGLHLLSLEYRAEEDMTIWAHGRGLADRIEIEWSDMFSNVYPDGGPVDAGVDGGPTDAGVDGGPSDSGSDGGPADAGVDGGPLDDSAADSGTAADNGSPADDGTVEDGSGCGCSSSGRPAAVLFGFLGLILLNRRRLH